MIIRYIFRLSFAFLFALLLINPLPAAAQTGNQVVELKVINDLGVPLCTVHIYLSLSANQGQNLLSDPIRAGSSRTFTMSPGVYILSVKDCLGNTLHEKAYTINVNGEIRVETALRRREIPPLGIPRLLSFWDARGGSGDHRCWLGQDLDFSGTHATSTDCDVLLGTTQVFGFFGFQENKKTDLTLVQPDGVEKKFSFTGNEYTLTIPEASPTGEYELIAKQGNLSLYGSFTVLKPTPRVWIEGNDRTEFSVFVKAGSPVTLRVGWFKPKERVDVYLYRQSEIKIMDDYEAYTLKEYVAHLGRYQLDGKGSLTLSIPTSKTDPSGEYEIWVMTNTPMSANFTLINGGPAAITFLTPQDSCGKAEVKASGLRVMSLVSNPPTHIATLKLGQVVDLPCKSSEILDENVWTWVRIGGVVGVVESNSLSILQAK
jgi:hypothetical protein